MGSRWWPSLLALSCGLSCGARTALLAPADAGIVEDAGGRDVLVEDAPADVAVMDVLEGCQTSADCNDGVSCTIKTCLPNHTCQFTPDDKLCPVSQVCDPPFGCEQRAWAEDSTTLYDVRLPSCVVKVVGPTSLQLTDLGLSPTNVLYGITFGSLASVDQTTGNATTIFPLDTSEQLNGADFGPDGTFYVSGGSIVDTVDLGTGALTQVATYPPGESSSGDLAFISGQLLGTAQTSGSDDLVVFDLGTGTSSVIGAVGFTCIWGLAAYGTSLYGFTCNGEIITIDPSTGAGTLAQNVGLVFYGASAR